MLHIKLLHITDLTFQQLGSLNKQLRRGIMLHYAVVFLVIAIIAGVLGFGGIAGSAVGIAKILFFVFIVIAVLSFILGRGR